MLLTSVVALALCLYVLVRAGGLVRVHRWAAWPMALAGVVAGAAGWALATAALPVALTALAVALLLAAWLVHLARHLAGATHTGAFYERIMDDLPIQLAVLDADFRYRYVNRGSLSDPVLRRWLIGRTDVEYALYRGQDPAIGERRQAWYRQVVATGQAGSLEETLTGPDSAPRHIRRVARPIFDDHGAVVRLVGFGLDITEKKQTEAALRESEARYRRLLNFSPVAIAVSDVEGTLRYVNRATLGLLGADRPEDLLGRSVFDFVLKDHWDELEARIEQLQDRRQVGLVERKIRRLDGEIRDIQVASLPIEYEGRPAAQSVIIDVTERRQVEAERERFVAELEKKNAELERFTYTVSHDLKSPLFTIKGFLGLLREDLAAGRAEAVAQNVARIDAATSRMGRLLDDLLELSRIGRLVNPPEAVPLDALVRETCDQLAGALAESGVAVRVAEDLPVVWGDRVRLAEVWQNLLENAIRFRGDTPRPWIRIDATTDGDRVHCRVRDNGPGIPPVYHEKVFGLFERLDPGTEGTGIGLALVRRIVEVHGGRVWIESEGNGQGTTMHFTLPAPPAEVPAG